MPQRPATYYAVLRERGENWDATRPMRQQEQWDAHATFMDALAESGFIVLGGPLGAGERQFLIIMAAEDEHTVGVRLADDPWTSLRMLRVEWIEPWKILLRASQ